MDSNVKRERTRNPRINTNIIEKLTYSWMIDLYKLGRNRDLEHEDLYEVLDDHVSSKLANELAKKWNMELFNAQKSNRNPSLLKALINMFGANYMFYGILHSFDELVLKVLRCLLIGGMLSYFDPMASRKGDLKHSYVCASGVVFSTLISILLRCSTIFAIKHCAMKVRLSCSSIIFRKALKLSHKALGETTVGQVVNLLSNDLNRFDTEFVSPHYIWIGPLQIIIVTYFLWQEIGVSSLFGIGVYLIVIPLQTLLGKKIFEIRLKTAKLTDERGRLINEIIASIQVIKMYTWERPFSKLIEYARKKEMEQIKKIICIHIVTFWYRAILIQFQVFVCILSYVLLGNSISIQKVFVIISLFRILHVTMSVFFCLGITRISDSLATIKRIQNFLLLEEKDAITKNTVSFIDSLYVNTNCNKNNDSNLKEVEIDISNVTATWDEGQNFNTLNDISLKIRPGQLAVIVGPVGAGKSSVIQLILQELPPSEGKVSVQGVISYASQEPWLFTGSVRQNILFDSPMNDKRYRQVVRACGLDYDFEKFPCGDKTIVGEKGVTLSGGQKSRINLARAIYKEADIYLLDDPLSAVDSRVSKHLFEKCIKEHLKEKICILTTHQIQYLRDEKLIFLMQKAHIVVRGSYQEIIKSGIDLNQLCGFSKESKIEFDNFEDIDSSNDVSKECIQSSVDESDRQKDEKKPREIAETRSSGSISKRVYMSYVSAFGSPFLIFCFFFMFITTQVLITAGDFWITLWVNQEAYVFYKKNNTSMNDTSPDTASSNFRQNYVIVFTALNILPIIAIGIWSYIFVTACTKASLNLHGIMFNAILRAKMYFFHSNPSGRILNRFSNDIGAIDENLPFLLLNQFQLVSVIVGIIFVFGLINVYIFIPTLIIGLIFYRMQNFYLSTSRSIIRLEGVARSPVLGHMNASVQGVTTIRAHKAEELMCNQFDNHQDFHSTVWYLNISSMQAFSLWMDLICLLYIGGLIFSILLFSSHTNGGYAGLVITQIMSLIGVLQFTIIQCAMIDNQMISVERILEYTKCPQENDNQCFSVNELSKKWPEFGRIVFKNLSLRYSPNSPFILKSLNFEIHSSEKIGIVGRTGAGKSSIIQALFRLAFDEGEIIIDGVQIHNLRLSYLRSKISVIPQDPVLYSGTMRYNLDPFDEFPDHVLWNALEEVQLKTSIENTIGGLNCKITDSGSNFSVGQKQLICLARALLRKNKILILDEATANIDIQTDTFIQNTIRKNFQTSTVITVAHRLNTIMDSDRVLVIDFGSVIEFDHPHVLLQKKDGLFYSMVEETGRTSADIIHRVAAKNFKTTLKKNSAS